jgi:hypothetical protein
MSQSPEAGIAGAVNQLTEETHVLIRREIQAAQRETWEKAKESMPGVALVVGAGVLAIFAAASSYRVALRALEKVASPVAAATAATGVFGAGAAGLAFAGIVRLRRASVPVPTETAKDTRRAIADTAEQID